MSKENHTLKDIINLLNLIVNTEFVAKMRQRYASPEQWEEERERFKLDQQINWKHCKNIICENKQTFDDLIKDELIFSDDERATYVAAVKAIEKEMQEQMEKVITGGNNEEH